MSDLAPAMQAYRTVLFREDDAAPARLVEIVGWHATRRLVLREVGPFWPGVWLAHPWQVAPR